MKMLAFASAALLLSAASPAVGRSPVEPGAPQRQCFWANEIRGFAAQGEEVVNVQAGRDVFRLELLGRCQDVDTSERIALIGRGGGESICTGLQAEIVVASSVGPRRCPVRTIRKLTPAEVEALPRRARP